MLTPDTIESLAQLVRSNKAPSPALPSDPDEAAAVALGRILDPSATVLPSEVFKELTRRNASLASAPQAEIQATISRQIALLEAMATRLFHRAAMTTNTSASTEFTRVALATERVLIQALGAIHQMNQNQALTVQGEDGVDVT